MGAFFSNGTYIYVYIGVQIRGPYWGPIGKPLDTYLVTTLNLPSSAKLRSTPMYELRAAEVLTVPKRRLPLLHLSYHQYHG